MPLFVISFLDKPDSLALRADTREAHLAYWRATGALKLGGPYLDPKGDPIGSLIVVEAADEAAARRLQEDDPYNTAGLVPHADVRSWRYTAGQLP
jgi:uncharacterized protein YciI